MANKKNKKNKNVAKKSTKKTVEKNNLNTELTNKERKVAAEKTAKQNNKIDNKKQENKKKTIGKAKKELVYADSGNDEIGKLVKLILLVTVIFIVFYFVTSFVTRKANAKKIAQKEKSEATTIQYENIIIGSMLNKDGDYYVLIEKDDDDNLSEYETLVQTISVNEEAPKIYKANLTDSFNKIYLSDKSNFDSDLEKFRVAGTTLIKVSNHAIAETYDNHESIKSKLDELK